MKELTKEQQIEKDKAVDKANREYAKLWNMAYAYCQIAKALVDECLPEDFENGAYKNEMDVIARGFARDMFRSAQNLSYLKYEIHNWECYGQPNDPTIEEELKDL